MLNISIKKQTELKTKQIELKLKQINIILKPIAQLPCRASKFRGSSTSENCSTLPLVWFSKTVLIN
jgi:hypothetical protein